MSVIDLSHTITEDMPVYPGTDGPRLMPANNYEGGGFKETLIQMFSHTGTHIDPPAHLFPDGLTLDQFPVDQFIGKALVIDCRKAREGEAITMDYLAPYGAKIAEAEFLLFNLGWDKRWGTKAYFGDYPCIDDAVLDLIIGGGYKGIGFDAIGLDPIADENLTRHKRLFSSCDIVNIENLANLEACGRDLLWFSCLPLKIQSADGSPIRAVAWLE